MPGCSSAGVEKPKGKLNQRLTDTGGTEGLAGEVTPGVTPCFRLGSSRGLSLWPRTSVNLRARTQTRSDFSFLASSGRNPGLSWLLSLVVSRSLISAKTPQPSFVFSLQSRIRFRARMRFKSTPQANCMAGFAAVDRGSWVCIMPVLRKAGAVASMDVEGKKPNGDGEFRPAKPPGVLS